MSQLDPYQPPKTFAEAPVDLDGTAHLAGRDQRFGAAMIDGLIGLALSVPVMMAMGTFEYVKTGQQPPLHLVIIGAVIGFCIFSAVHYVTLAKNGQTIGKRFLKIRIATLRGEKPTVGHILGVRYLPISVVQVIPILGSLLSLIDIAFIFRSDRRCLHDLIAGTQVVRCE